MANQVCEKCGHQINPEWRFCNQCGNPLSEKDKNKIEDKNIKKDKEIKSSIKTYSITEISLIIAFVTFIIASLFLYMAYDVKNNYYLSETSNSLNDNAYVGGDAYNYIINSGYFSGYMSFSGALYITSTLFVMLGIKNKEK